MKILVLGDNSEDTDLLTSELAKNHNTVNHGLLTDNILLEKDGFYHTNLVDMSFGAIVELAKTVDKTIMLDQPLDRWSHWKVLLSTYKAMVEIDNLGLDTEYRDNNNIKKVSYFYNLVRENPSFCIYPWILKQADKGVISVCTRSETKITDQADDWQTNADYAKIRNAMLEGTRLPEHCKSCYKYEDKGIESSRQFETMDWVAKLDVETVEDLKNIKSPYYYEIRLDNKCNLMCRSCKPAHSHLIEREFKEIKLEYTGFNQFNTFEFDQVDISNLTSSTRIYVAGGEPTVNEKLFDFMRECIKAGKTDFDFAIGTNGMVASSKLLSLTKHFTNLNFSVSIDGYGEVNRYLRWPSDFDTIVKNTKKLQEQGHTISFLIVPSIYNVTNLHLLFEFLDKDFPTAGVYLQINHFPEKLQDAYNNPNVKKVLESLDRIKKTQVYYSDGRSCKSTIDSLYNHYSNNPAVDLVTLKKFFEFNDKLDASRGIKLGDVIPELDEYRSLVYPSSTT